MKLLIVLFVLIVVFGVFSFLDLYLGIEVPEFFSFVVLSLIFVTFLVRGLRNVVSEYRSGRILGRWSVFAAFKSIDREDKPFMFFSELIVTILVLLSLIYFLFLILKRILINI